MPVERRSEPSSQSLALDAALDKVAEKLRADPKTFERARAFARLRDELHLDEEEIARRVGVHKSVVSRLLALLKQPEETQKLVADESRKPAALPSIEPTVSAPTELQKTVTRESTRSAHSPDAIAEQHQPNAVAAQATIEEVPRWEIERRMQLSGMLRVDIRLRPTRRSAA